MVLAGGAGRAGWVFDRGEAQNCRLEARLVAVAVAVAEMGRTVETVVAMGVASAPARRRRTAMVGRSRWAGVPVLCSQDDRRVAIGNGTRSMRCSKMRRAAARLMLIVSY